MPFVVILARGIQVSRLGCYGAAWALTPNLDRVASQSLVFDHFLRENTQPKMWGAQLSGRPKPWCWSGNAPDFAHRCSNLNLVDAPPNNISGFPNWLKTVWPRLSEIQADLLVIELADAIPPWKPEQEDLEAYFPPLDESVPHEPEDQATLNPLENPKASTPSSVTPDLIPWDGPLSQGNPAFGTILPTREQLLLTHAAAIATLDKKLGSILEFLADHQTASTHILVTSDQGIALGEKGLYGHGVSVPWLDYVHVPLIWCHPTREAGSLRHGALVSDRTLTELLCSDPAAPQGLLEKCWESPREMGFASVVSQGPHPAFARRAKSWSLVVEGPETHRLFEFPTDHWEVNDLGARFPNEMQSLLQQTENETVPDCAPDQPGGQPR